MTAAEYPAIGFDPAPGKLESVEDLNSKLSRAATGLDNAYTTLTGITKGGKTWEGEAASAFAEKVGDLPRYVGDSRDALREASLQLSSWRSKLADYQQKAREYEAQAKAAKEREKTGQGTYDRAASAYNQAAADPALRLVGPVLRDAERTRRRPGEDRRGVEPAEPGGQGPRLRGQAAGEGAAGARGHHQAGRGTAGAPPVRRPGHRGPAAQGQRQGARRRFLRRTRRLLHQGRPRHPELVRQARRPAQADR